jgi:glutathione synthase/RimK-type ligase-like ATP-grasp enzyme
VSRKSVLIVTHSADDHVPLVERELARLDTSFFRFNTETYFAEFALAKSAPNVQFFGDSRQHAGEEFGAVLFRHIKTEPAVHYDELDARRLVVSEMEAALEGSVLALQPNLWINHPFANKNTRNKVLQLRVAAGLGFEVPETVVTSEPSRIRRCFELWGGQMVAKLVGGQLVGRSIDEQFVIHTTKLTVSDIEDDASLSATPALYQRLVQKAYDVRVTVIGDRVVSCRIGSQARQESTVDWRAAGFRSLEHEVCRAIVKRYGLHMAGIDLVQRGDGSYVFLEINAAGQWRWIEEMTGAPIASEIAQQLNSASSGAVSHEYP